MGNSGYKPEGYVFISHSHQDIEKVREIRNAMEKAGFEPLCFYLKCLHDEDEIEDLIKREINAREWFVYIDSPNARASKWVTRERKYIESLNSKQIIFVDLEAEPSMEEVAKKLIRGLRVLIVCCEDELDLARTLREKFIQKDMQATISQYDAAEDGTLAEHLKKQAENGKEYGCILTFLSRDGIQAEQLAEMLPEAIESGMSILPVLTEGYDPTEYIDTFRTTCNAAFQLRRDFSDAKLEEFVRMTEERITHDMRKAFSEAKSHREIESYHMEHLGDPEAERLAEEAHDRLDELEQIKEDLMNSVRMGTMKMTEELKKFLES